MEPELTINRQELVAKAKAMGLKFHSALGNVKLADMIEKAEKSMTESEGAELLDEPKTGFDEEAYRKEMETKARIEAEAKAKVEIEMLPPKVDVKRRPSPEEVIVKTHPEVDIIFVSDDGQDSPLHCSYGGKKWLMFPSKSYSVPYGFADFLQSRQYPVVTQVPDPDAPGETMPKRTGWKPRFSITIVNHRQYAEAQDKSRELGFIPHKEREKERQKENEKQENKI